MRASSKYPPIHPGEVLRQEFMEPLGLTQYGLAKKIHVPPRRINQIVHGTRAVSADTALRLGQVFGIAPRFWMNLQALYDLEVAQEAEGAQIRHEISPLTECVALH